MDSARRKKQQEVLWSIRTVRERRRLTQSYLAERLGISLTAYRNLESGASALTLERFFEIADILSTSIPTLLGIEPETPANIRPESHTGTIIEMLRRMQASLDALQTTPTPSVRASSNGIEL